jgi:hypothetical protein
MQCEWPRQLRLHFPPPPPPRHLEPRQLMAQRRPDRHPVRGAAPHKVALSSSVLGPTAWWRLSRPTVRPSALLCCRLWHSLASGGRGRAIPSLPANLGTRRWRPRLCRMMCVSVCSRPLSRVAFSCSGVACCQGPRARMHRDCMACRYFSGAGGRAEEVNFDAGMRDLISLSQEANPSDQILVGFTHI